MMSPEELLAALAALRGPAVDREVVIHRAGMIGGYAFHEDQRSAGDALMAALSDLPPHVLLRDLAGALLLLADIGRAHAAAAASGRVPAPSYVDRLEEAVSRLEVRARAVVDDWRASRPPHASIAELETALGGWAQQQPDAAVPSLRIRVKDSAAVIEWEGNVPTARCERCGAQRPAPRGSPRDRCPVPPGRQHRHDGTAVPAAPARSGS